MLNGLVRNNRLLILVPFNGPVQFIQHLLPFAGQGSPDPELNAVVESVVYQGLWGGQKFQKQPFLLQVFQLRGRNKGFGLGLAVQRAL